MQLSDVLNIRIVHLTTRVVDNLFTAVQIALETAAKNLKIIS